MKHQKTKHRGFTLDELEVPPVEKLEVPPVETLHHLEGGPDDWWTDGM